MKIIKELREYLPLITILVIGFSYLRTAIYFQSYNITLAHYIQLSEVVTTIISDLFRLLVIVLIYLSLSPKPDIEAWYYQSKQKSKSKTRTVVSKAIRRREVGMFIFIILMALLKYATGATFWSIVLTVVILMLIESSINVFYRIALSKVQNMMSQIKLISLLLAVLVATGFADRLSTHFSHKYIQYEIEHDSTTIKTNDEIVYVGRTEKFLFVHNNSLKQTTVFPADEIKSFKVISIK